MKKESKKGAGIKEIIPSTEEMQKELAKAKSIDD